VRRGEACGSQLKARGQYTKHPKLNTRHPTHLLEKRQKYTTEALAEFVLRLQAEDIPSATVEMVQRCVLDLVGAAAAGAQSEAALIARDGAERLGAAGSAVIWFGGGRRPAAFAAYANSAAASALDLDDGHRTAGGHPGAAVIPAVLAVAQEVQAGWPEVLAAVVAGYEVGVRISAARDFTVLDTLATGRWCAYGVAAAACRLRRLSVGRTAEAMAVAGVLSPGLSAAGYSQVMGNHTKEGIPWATLTGLWAAELAAGGFTGPLDILDHRGYYDTAKILAGLGGSFVVDGVYFKPYACCRWIHCALDGLCDLMECHHLPAADIDSIEVYTFERALRLNNLADPDNIESAQYSLPFCLAVAAYEGKAGLLPMSAGLLHRPDLVALAGRVSLHVDAELERMFPERTAARVVITASGRRFQADCRHPLGDPANPMDWGALVLKFRGLTRGLMPASGQEAIIRAVLSLPAQGLTRLHDRLAAPLG
jgi:2-methylcitrate dehydratase PrpD